MLAAGSEIGRRAGRSRAEGAVRMKLSILIPVFNERRLLPELLLLIPPALAGVDCEVILVDDGSTDGTREWIAETLTGANGPLEPYARVPVKVILHERNQGKGAAIRTAIRAARGDAMVIQDADLEYDPADLVPMWKLIESGRADVVYGSRFYGRPHRCLYFHHYFANKLLSMLFSVLYNQILSDLEVCYKMFRREVLQHLSLRADDFGFEIEFSANVARARLRIYEVGISYFGRTYAEGKKISWKDGVKALWYVFRFRFA
jgi:glycosyltransferase involved in cell wall biosynthesis